MSSTEDLLDFLQFLDNLTDMDLLSYSTPRLIRARTNHFHNYDELDFFKRYRMSKNSVLLILRQINDELEFDSDRNESVAPVQQLLIALRYFATGTHFKGISDAYGVSIATVSRIVKKVSKALAKLQQMYIKMPSSKEEIERCQKEFYDIANFPFVVGCIDCTHVKIQSPGGDDPELYRNRKGYFSLNVQTVTDANLKVTNVVARWPGSTHDSTIFRSSQLCQDFEMGVYGSSCLLGDNGYSLKSYLLTPYLQTNTIPQEQYNLSHMRTRNTVEKQHEVLKRRFPALAVGLRVNLQTAVDVVVACCVLHNICIDNGEDIPPNDMDDTNFDDTIFCNGQIECNYNYHTNNFRNDDRRTMIVDSFFT